MNNEEQNILQGIRLELNQLRNQNEELARVNQDQKAEIERLKQLLVENNIDVNKPLEQSPNALPGNSIL